MAEPVFEVTPKKYTGETAIVSVRLAKDMVRDVDAVAAATGRTRNELISMSIEFALKHLKINEE